MIKSQKVASIITLAAFFATVMIIELSPLAAFALIGVSIVSAIIGKLGQKHTSYEEIRKERGF